MRSAVLRTSAGSAALRRRRFPAALGVKRGDSSLKNFGQSLGTGVGDQRVPLHSLSSAGSGRDRYVSGDDNILSSLSIQCHGTIRSYSSTCVIEEAKEDTTAEAVAGGAGAATPPTSTSDPEDDSDDTSPDPDNHDDIEELLSSQDYDPQTAVDDIFMASRWNQGLGPSGEWNPAFVRDALDNYERHLHYVLHKLNTTAASSSARDRDSGTSKQKSDGDDDGDSVDEEFRSIAERIDPDETKVRATKWLLSSNTVSRAFRSITRANLDTYDMGRRVRALERLIGSISLTPLTDLLSQNLLEANGKAGNVGRTLSLLALRKSRNYPPTKYEFDHAIQSIESAGLYLRKNRNVFLGEKGQPPLDNPTRWLDAILLNMSSRGVQLDTETANRMLDCYASMGRTGKAVHFFYDVVRDFVEEDGTYYGPMRDVGGGGDSSERQQAEGRNIPKRVLKHMPTFYNRKIKVRMRMRDPPPFHKVPSRVKGTLVRRQGSEDGATVTKLDQESERAWSPALTAAFAFADSLTHGACGHRPVELDKKSWNILIAACCNRGALWRAMQIADETMPNNGHEPDVYTYNTILGALARVGDVQTMRELMTKMNNSGVNPHSFTVDFLVSGHLNAGDIGGAVTIVQDMFNQHSVLPPYTTHLNIIEFALANDLVYEAKRHVYFLQQLWKWKPNDSVKPEFRKLMHLTKNNPKLTKKALKKLFRFFGEELTDEDFF